MILKNLPQFKTEKEFLSFLVENESELFVQAKAQIKKADAFESFQDPVLKKINTKKQLQGGESDLLNKDVLTVKAVINTTNILDSHKDVHIPGLWNKSLKENAGRILHVQEHKTSEFNKIIASGQDLKASAQKTTFKELGYDYDGETEALMFNSKVRKNRNSYMHETYAKGYVTNHSVGMRYVKMVTCINDEDYPVQKENWDKYAPMIANQEALEGTKYFWAVLEAKVIEGSAVPTGSNWVTPTTEVKNNEDENEVDEKDVYLKFLNLK